MSENSMVIFSRAATMLAEADTIQKAKELKSLALTAADWAKRKGMGEQAIMHCRSYALEAERKMGAMLAETERAKGTDKGGKPKIDGSRVLPSNPPPTLATLGLTKRESAEAQKLATLPAASFQAVKDGTKTRTQVRREQQREAVVRKSSPIPSGKFRILYADPPWKYGDQLTENYGATRFHYPAMSITELCALPIADIAEKDAVLFLWVTSPILPEAFAVISAWGFVYKAAFVWDKIAHNMGHYNSVRHEFLLICTRGSCLPDCAKLIDSVQSVERGKHSEKPAEFRKIIETLYTHGEKLELFARAEVAGWKTWGNELNA